MSCFLQKYMYDFTLPRIMDGKVNGRLSVLRMLGVQYGLIQIVSINNDTENLDTPDVDPHLKNASLIITGSIRRTGRSHIHIYIS